MKYSHELRNAGLIGIAAITTTFSLVVNTPPVLAAGQEMMIHSTDQQPNRADRVPIKRVINFNLLGGTKKVEQVSYAHRVVPSDHNKKDYWVIEPFEEVKIPKQKGFVPSVDKFSTVTEVSDLEELPKTIDVFYRPLDKKKQGGGTEQIKIQTDHSQVDDKEQQEANKKAQTELGGRDERAVAQENKTSDSEEVEKPVTEERIAEENDKEKPRNLHQRVKDVNNRLGNLKKEKDKKAHQGMLPQTGNETDTSVTLIGLGITIAVAGMSLFSLKKVNKKK